MAFSYSPKIVTDGLVLYLDAGNPLSYPGSGTTWTDLSRGQNPGTLINGPTFDSGNNGSIVFDGVDDYVNCGDFFNYPNFTICVTLNTDTLGDNTDGLYGGNSGNNGTSTWVLYPNTNFGTAVNQIRLFVAGEVLVSTQSINDTGWRHLTLTKSSTTYTLYLESIYESSGTTSNTPKSIFLIGDSGESSRFLNGKVGNIQIYNRALTASEILQNYNATKTRFGLT